jgi:PAS domain S-box-containing protein
LTAHDSANHAPDDQDGQRSTRIDERRERLGVTLLSIGDAVIVTDERGKVTLLNPVAEALTGWADRDAKDLPIESVFRIVDEVTREPVNQPVQGVIENGLIQFLARRTLLIAKDGSERSIDDSAAPILSGGGDLDGVVLIFRDITERRRQEQRLEDTRLQGEVIVATVREALVVLSRGHRVESANRSYYETFRASPEETVGRSLFDLGDGQWDSPELRALLEGIVTEDTSFDDFEVERSFPAIGARSMLLNARKLYREDGRPEMILLAIEDVTGQSRSPLALVASEIRFRRLFEAAKDGILILEADTGAIVDANPFLLDLLGYTHADLLGKKLWDIGLLGDVEASKASFRELQERGYVRYENLPLEARDKRHVEVEVVSNVYRAGETLIIQCNIRDVTERKRAEEELRRAKEAAEEAGRVKDRFLATLSHELRTPLTPVLATIAYIEQRPGLPEDLREEFASIRRNVELEARLIDDLLDVTRIGQGKLELHREAVNAHATLRAALEVCQGEAEVKGLEVSLALRAKVHHIWADPVRIQQVFWNLIRNAVKFTPAGGCISLRSADAGAGRLVIEVADTGVGIQREAIPRIFDAFEQGGTPVTRRYGGLGLGLAIAKTLVELHGGSLTVTSGGRDSGSLFRIELETIPPPKIHDPPSDPAAGEGQPNLLLVEDNSDTRRAIALLLRSSGFTVRTAGSVVEAFAALADERFDLLVSDIGLPDGSGLDIMRHGRARVGLKGIAFSGYGSPGDVRESMEAGFSHHLTKPASLDTLVALIRRTVA